MGVTSRSEIRCGIGYPASYLTPCPEIRSPATRAMIEVLYKLGIDSQRVNIFYDIRGCGDRLSDGDCGLQE